MPYASPVVVTRVLVDANSRVYSRTSPSLVSKHDIIGCYDILVRPGHYRQQHVRLRMISLVRSDYLDDRLKYDVCCTIKSVYTTQTRDMMATCQSIIISIDTFRKLRSHTLKKFLVLVLSLLASLNLFFSGGARLSNNQNSITASTCTIIA